MKKYIWVVLAGLAVAVGHAAHAAFDLQVTEIWPGNEPGEDLTDDWFEVTNFGDMAWTDADGPLYYDDDSQDAEAADPLMGVTSIAPGESVVFVDGDGIGQPNVALWVAAWGPDLTALPQIGSYEGSGLGGGGDGVTLFLDANMDGPTADEIIEFADYPDADSNGGQSWDVVLGEFSTPGNASGAVETSIQNDEMQPAIGSPGSSAVPEPATLVLAVLCGLALYSVRRCK